MQSPAVTETEKKVAVRPETILSPEPDPEPVVPETETVESENEPDSIHFPEPIPEEDESEYVPAQPSSGGNKIIDIEGIGPVYSKALNAADISTTDEFLESGSTRNGRDQLAEYTGISPKLILEWVNLADLYRVKGVGEEWSDLLEEAGVDTVPELASVYPRTSTRNYWRSTRRRTLYEELQASLWLRTG